MPVFYVKYLEHIVTHGWSYKNARFYCPLQSRLHHRITFSLQFPASVNLWTFRISFLAEPMQNSKVSSCFPYCRFIWIHLVFMIFGQKVESSLLSRKLRSWSLMMLVFVLSHLVPDESSLSFCMIYTIGLVYYMVDWVVVHSLL